MTEAKAESRIEDARLEAERARKRLASTVGAIQRRLRPNNLMNEALERVREQTGKAADTAIGAAKRRPLTIAAVATGLTLILFRRPLRRAVAGMIKRRAKEHDVPAESLGVVTQRPKKSSKKGAGL